MVILCKACSKPDAWNEACNNCDPKRTFENE